MCRTKYYSEQARGEVVCQSPTKSSQGVTAQMPPHAPAATAGFAVATGTLGQWWALRACRWERAVVGGRAWARDHGLGRAFGCRGGFARTFRGLGIALGHACSLEVHPHR